MLTHGASANRADDAVLAGHVGRRRGLGEMQPRFGSDMRLRATSRSSLLIGRQRHELDLTPGFSQALLVVCAGG